MTSKTKIAVAAAFVAVLATPAFAQGRHQHELTTQSLSEGRNSAVISSSQGQAINPLVPPRDTALGN
jgi:hypothetical protein